MKIMYNMSPDVKITSHGIQFGSGDWTVVTQNMSGTFTGIFKTPTGKSIKPTGNKFEIQVCSLLKWKNDRIIEERIFSDDDNFNKQLGINNCDLLNSNKYYSKYLKYKIKYNELKKKLEKQRGRGENTLINKYLEIYHIINFEGFNKRNWDLVRKFFYPNMIATFSNGTKIIGLEENIKIMKESLKFAPDTQVISHKIQFGSGEWTSENWNEIPIFSEPPRNIDKVDIFEDRG